MISLKIWFYEPALFIPPHKWRGLERALIDQLRIRFIYLLAKYVQQILSIFGKNIK
jgi:hypothetical protein